MAGVSMKVLGGFLVALCLLVPLISAKATDVKYCGMFLGFSADFNFVAQNFDQLTSFVFLLQCSY